MSWRGVGRAVVGGSGSSFSACGQVGPHTAPEKARACQAQSGSRTKTRSSSASGGARAVAGTRASRMRRGDLGVGDDGADVEPSAREGAGLHVDGRPESPRTAGSQRRRSGCGGDDPWKSPKGEQPTTGGSRRRGTMGRDHLNGIASLRAPCPFARPTISPASSSRHFGETLPRGRPCSSSPRPHAPRSAPAWLRSSSGRGSRTASSGPRAWWACAGCTEPTQRGIAFGPPSRRRPTGPSWGRCSRRCPRPSARASCRSTWSARYRFPTTTPDGTPATP
jgi:hypothetical protein